MKESKAPSLGRTPAQKFLDKWQGLIYLIPWIIGFIVFKAIPFGQSLYYSFTDMNFFNRHPPVRRDELRHRLL